MQTFFYVLTSDHYLLTMLLLIQLAACILFSNGQEFRPLGDHAIPSGGPVVLYGKFPPPAVFYNHFVRTGKLLQMVNVLNETGYGIYQTWTDDYLRDRHGEETVEIEKGKKEDRERPRGKLKFSKFLELYQKVDMYMINPLPKSMQDEVEVPFTLQCGGFQTALQGSYVWFSSGDTRSVLHYDVMDNINCLLEGEKTILVIDKKYKDKVEADGFVQSGKYSLVDVDALDFYSFPGILKSPWSRIHMKKGDCVYIPYKYYHHIKSAPGRNLAVNFWFSHLLWFNKTDCTDVDRDTPSKSYSQFDIASTNEQLRSEIFSPFEGLKNIKKDVFSKRSLCSDAENEQMWNMMNSDKDDRLSWQEIYHVDMDKLVVNIPECIDKLMRVEEQEETTGNDNVGTSDEEEDKMTGSDNVEEVSEDSPSVTDNGTLQSTQTVEEKEEIVHDEF